MAWLPVVQTEAPTDEPISLSEAKAQCRVTGNSEDATLNDLIASARAHVEQVCSLRIMPQTVELAAESFSDLARLPVRPVTEVAGIVFLDANGDEQPLSSSAYRPVLAGLTGCIVLKPHYSWPATLAAPDAVKVTATVGYETVPADLKRAMLLMIADWFAERERPGEIDGTVSGLLANFAV